MKQIKKGLMPLLAAVCVLAIAVMAGGCQFLPTIPHNDSTVPSATVEPTETPTVPAPTEEPTTEPTEPPHNWEIGYIATANPEATYTDADGTPLGVLSRGTQVDYELDPNGGTTLLLGETIVYLQSDAWVVTDPAEVIPAHTLYVRTAVNLRNRSGRLMHTFAEKGTVVDITGCDYVNADGTAHMYRVSLDGEEGYIMPWYLADSEEAALANYDDGDYATHEGRGNRYGGGGAANLDYYPRQKGPIEGNVMPEECRALYIVAWRVAEVEEYLQIAKDSGINAFVVDITDGGSIGYAADVMNTYCPSAAAAANNSVQDYQAAIRKIKDAGYYVIGRITTFNDSYFVQDHPEYAITDPAGAPLKLSGEYWPTAYNRAAWQYKVDLAVEAVELMGFNEIQFDYVRFPDLTWSYEEAGTIDYHNTYGETKAQAIQRFLMYATDILHEQGAYVSADVYGESAFNYVTAYGQYWPAISNVVDAISGMPYPDHFSASGDYRPWEHPYDTLYNWGSSVMYRQAETATPAAVRTWIQAYNAIREPYNTYGPDEVGDQIRALRDSGCTGGYITWNAESDLEKYNEILLAF